MSHLDVDIFEFLILTLIPVAALFIIEMICRVVKVQSWPKLAVQGIAMVFFGIAYLTMETPHTLTALCLLALASCIVLPSKACENQSKKISLLNVF